LPSRISACGGGAGNSSEGAVGAPDTSCQVQRGGSNDGVDVLAVTIDDNTSSPVGTDL
jgi:hypothetical protein